MHEFVRKMGFGGPDSTYHQTVIIRKGFWMVRGGDVLLNLQTDQETPGSTMIYETQKDSLSGKLFSLENTMLSQTSCQPMSPQPVHFYLFI